MGDISVKEVKVLTTIFDFNPQDKNYEYFLQARKAWLKSMGGDTASSGNRHLQKAAGKNFDEFISEYLKNIGIEGIEGNNRVYVGAGMGVGEKNKIAYDCKKIPIHMLDKISLIYTPYLKFEATSEKLAVDSSLKRAHSWQSYVLEDIMDLAQQGNGLDLPKWENQKGEIKISSIEQIQNFIRAIEKIYNNAGAERLRKLYNLHNAVYGVQDKEEAKEILNQEYSKRLELLLPVNLF